MNRKLVNGLILVAAPLATFGGLAAESQPEAFTVESAEQKVLPRYPLARRVADEMPAGVEAREDIVYATPEGVPLALDVYRPPGPGVFPAVLIVHGGGWESGSRQMERPFAKQLAALGYVTVPVSYRLGPAGRFPAALHDLKSAVRWLRVRAATYAIDPSRIAILGMSAGGQLAALVGATNGRAEFEGAVGERSGSSIVQAVVDIDGLADFTGAKLVAQQEASPSAPVRFLGAKFSERPTVWRAASALTHVGPASAPTLFINSTVDSPILPGRAQMRARLHAAGVAAEWVVIPDTPHPFWLFHPWAEPALAAADRFLRVHLSGKM